MWLADKMYIAYSVGCILVILIYGLPTLNWGLFGSLALLWLFVTIIYAEYRNG